MTVADNTSRNQYTATPSQALFAYTFEIVDKDDIVVLINGTPLSEGTDYTVTGVGSDTGGNIVLTSGTTGGNIVTIYRDMPYSRTQNYTNSGDFLASEVNSDFDRLWLAGEQTDRSFSQSIRKPITDSDSISMELPVAASRADKFLTFDSNGAVTTTAVSSATAPQNIYRQQMTGDGTTTAFTLNFDSGSVGGAIVIYIDGVYQEGDTYNASGTSLVFTEAPPTNASIEVMYFKVAVAADIDTTGTIYSQQFTGNGSTTAYTLGIPPGSTGKALQIFINGVYQDQGSYTVSGATLTFSEAPPNTSQIDVIAFRIKEIGATDANLVTYTPAGTGAVPTTVQTKLRETVSVKDFGAVGDGVTDDTAAIQAALDLAGDIHIPDGDYRVDTQLVIKSNTNLILSKNAKILRGWAGTAGSRPDNSTIKNENALLASAIAIDGASGASISTYDTNIHISGGQWGHFNNDATTYRGTHVSLVGVRDGSFTSSQFNTQELEWCTHFWVERFHISDLQFNIATGGSNVSNDCLHIIGGKDITVDNIRGGGDDDFIAIGSNLNIGIDNVSVSNLSCDTNSNAVKIFQIRSGETSAFVAPTNKIKNVSVSNISGSVAAVRTGVIDLLIDGHTSYSLLENIGISDVNVEYAGTHDASNSIVIDLSGGVGVSLSNIRITGTPVRNMLTASNVTDLDVDGFYPAQPSKASAEAIELTNCTNVSISNSDITPTSNASTAPAIRCTNTTGIRVNNVKASEIDNARSLILLSGTCDAMVTSCRADKLSGATTSKGVAVNTGATIASLVVADCDFSRVNIPVDSTPSPTSYVISNVLGTDDIFSASSDGTTGGTSSAGAGNQYVELSINGTKYKVLHDGTI